VDLLGCLGGDTKKRHQARMAGPKGSLRENRITLVDPGKKRAENQKKKKGPTFREIQKKRKRKVAQGGEVQHGGKGRQRSPRKVATGRKAGFVGKRAASQKPGGAGKARGGRKSRRLGGQNTNAPRNRLAEKNQFEEGCLTTYPGSWSHKWRGRPKTAPAPRGKGETVTKTNVKGEKFSRGEKYTSRRGIGGEKEKKKHKKKLVSNVWRGWGALKEEIMGKREKLCKKGDPERLRMNSKSQVGP